MHSWSWCNGGAGVMYWCNGAPGEGGVPSLALGGWGGQGVPVTYGIDQVSLLYSFQLPPLPRLPQTNTQNSSSEAF